MNKLLSRFILVTSILHFASVKAQQSAEDEAARLVSAMLGDTPIVADLRQLTDEIGGRATGSEANLKSVEWALAKFKEAGVEARKEGFMMPALWRERSVKIEIAGAANFSPAAACMPFSSGTPATGLTAALIDGGFGADDDFKRLGAAAQGAFVLIETHELLDLDGLFKEYNEGARIEQRAFAAGVAGVVYTGSRPRNVLYRHNASLGYNNKHPLLVMERDAALRCLRLLAPAKRCK